MSAARNKPQHIWPPPNPRICDPFGRLVNVLVDATRPGTGVLTPAVQNAKSPWAGQLSGGMSES
jgi:hypothetical protein